MGLDFNIKTSFNCFFFKHQPPNSFVTKKTSKSHFSRVSNRYSLNLSATVERAHRKMPVLRTLLLLYVITMTSFSNWPHNYKNDSL